MNQKPKNLSYNSPKKRECFNSRNHVNWTDTARQITDDDCARSHEIIQALIEKTKQDLNHEQNQ